MLTFCEHNRSYPAREVRLGVRWNHVDEVNAAIGPDVNGVGTSGAPASAPSMQLLLPLQRLATTQQTWRCDVCSNALFTLYEETVAHEEACAKNKASEAAR